jgi:hypothetical protein
LDRSGRRQRAGLFHPLALQPAHAAGGFSLNESQWWPQRSHLQAQTQTDRRTRRIVTGEILPW